MYSKSVFEGEFELTEFFVNPSVAFIRGFARSAVILNFLVGNQNKRDPNLSAAFFVSRVF